MKTYFCEDCAFLERDAQRQPMADAAPAEAEDESAAVADGASTLGFTDMHVVLDYFFGLHRVCVVGPRTSTTCMPP